MYGIFMRPTALAYRQAGYCYDASVVSSCFIPLAGHLYGLNIIEQFIFCCWLKIEAKVFERCHLKLFVLKRYLIIIRLLFYSYHVRT